VERVQLAIELSLVLQSRGRGVAREKEGSSLEEGFSLLPSCLRRVKRFGQKIRPGKEDGRGEFR
jgi:hypothetical protein